MVEEKAFVDSRCSALVVNLNQRESPSELKHIISWRKGKQKRQP